MNKIRSFLSRFNSEYFFSIPSQSKVLFALLAFYFLLIAYTLVLSTFFSKKDKIYKQYLKNFVLANFIFSFLGLFLAFSRYETLVIFSWRFWQYLIITMVVLYNLYFFTLKQKTIKKVQLKYVAKERKEKWLPKSKKKKK